MVPALYGPSASVRVNYCSPASLGLADVIHKLCDRCRNRKETLHMDCGRQLMGFAGTSSICRSGRGFPATLGFGLMSVAFLILSVSRQYRRIP